MRVLVMLGIAAALLGGWRLWERLRPPSVATWKAHMRDGAKARDVTGNRLRAEHHFLRALTEARKFGDSDPRHAETLIALADLYAIHADTTPAHWWEVCRALWERRGAGAASMRRQLDKGVFRLHARRSSPQRALMYREALAIYDRAYPPDDPRLLPHYQLLADRLLYRIPPPCDVLMGGTLYQRILRIREKQVGAESPALIPALEQLAALHGAQHNPPGVFRYRHRIFEINVKAFGPYDDRTACLLEEWLTASYRARMGEIPEEFLLNRLATARRTFGRDDYRLVRELRLLANTYRRWGRHADAEPLYRQIITLAERHYHMPWTRMDESFLYHSIELRGDKYAGQLRSALDTYASQLRATGRHREADALWIRLTD